MSNTGVSQTKRRTDGEPKRERRRQEDRTRETIGRLIDATQYCIATYGYGDTTLAKITEQAGLTRGAHLHHFSTKAQLIEEATRHFAKRVFERLEAAFTSALGKEKRVDALIDAIWIDVLKSDDGRVLQELLNASRLYPELVEQNGARYQKGLANYIAAIWHYFEYRAGAPLSQEEVLPSIYLQLQGLLLNRPMLDKTFEEWQLDGIKSLARRCLVPREEVIGERPVFDLDE